MPFVTVRILQGQPANKLDRIAAEITQTINAQTKIPEDKIWVVIEEVKSSDWYAGGLSAKGSS